MDLTALYDGTTLAIVVGGTALATVLRCGRSDVAATVRVAARQMVAPSRFDSEAVRASLARAAQDFQRNGPLRANPRSTGDGEFDDALHALLAHRSMARFDDALADAREKRLGPVEAAIRTLMQATELAPVFGLAGTLISLSQMPAQGVDRGAYLAAIGMAVHATLYGLVLANLLLAPLARVVERHARAEEAARHALAQWFEAEIAPAMMPQHEGRAHHPNPGVAA
ncbi:MotA/TolQ/ExbB proton channel family protein [Novosphingobium humi]|uniref:MotA/TolQ/ExbB proton channel family protein n=1 Tax=Novosphingobium humi TaxID=2282397 RepID=UPI0025B14E82|nr:MotA/TolQ/ExbB proton channel family protein [Novosphingobium humi]WJS99595.1 MotA/TolQ/ExbB proton channel family protein [Novosphingobium humi]